MLNEKSINKFIRIAIACILILLENIHGVHGKGSFPEPLEPCHLDDEACYGVQAQNYLQNYKYGIPERNVPSLEPLDLGTLSITIGEPSSSMYFSLVLSNTTLHNFGSALVVKSLKIRGAQSDLSKPVKAIMSMSTPELEVRANHDLQGKMLILPINSQGKINIRLLKVQVKTMISFLPEKRADGHTYLKITDYKSIDKINGGNFNMTNLFKDNPALSESTLKVLNDEWDALSLDVRPKLMEAADRVSRATVQTLLDTVPYDEMFIY